MRLNRRIVASFQDEAASGTNTDRKGFQALVAAAKRKEFDAVNIYDISCGSRVTWATGLLLEKQ